MNRKVVFKTAIVFLTALIPRLLFVNETSIMTDEPLYVSAGRKYFHSILKLDFKSEVWRINAEHPPIAKILMGFTSSLYTQISGEENTHNIYLGARIAPITVGTLTCVIMYLFGRKYYGEKEALLASLLSATSPWLVYYSTLGILDIFVAFFITLTFMSLNYTVKNDKYYILAGIFLGLAIASKGTAVAAISGIIFHFFITKIFLKKTENRGKFLENVKNMALILITAITIFFISWPWLWKDTLTRIFWVLGYHINHAMRGHLTFYAGKVYTHVPPYTPIYIIFVKTPILTFVLCIISTLNILIKMIRERDIQPSYVTVFSWFTGGVLTMSASPLLIADHYVVFLGPAVFTLASIIVLELPRFLGKTLSFFKGAGIMSYILAFFMIVECLWGLGTYASSPCGYANELIIRADKAILMIDTGYEDVAEYLIRYGRAGSKLAVSYAPYLLRIELLRKGDGRFEVVELKDVDKADYAVFPSIYVQRWGIPIDAGDGWNLIYIVRSGESVLCYLFERSS